jgi:tRNA-splicing ligase RtcB
MLERHDFTKLSEVSWELPKGARPQMRVPARVFANPDLFTAMLTDRSLEQLANVAALPGIQRFAIGMPDLHEGYGFPVGGVAATLWPDGLISPGGIGYDINCGVRLLRTDRTVDQVRQQAASLARELFHQIPSGVGRGGRWKLSNEEFADVLRLGVEWTERHGYASADDRAHLESQGRLEAADPDTVSDHAKNRGREQLGTIGAGNHFVEVGYVDEVFDREAAAAFGLSPGHATILIHTGSRGLGHQVATDAIRQMVSAMPKYGIELPDRELAGAPWSSPEGQAYFSAMSAAANFAWTNRQMITHALRQAWASEYGASAAVPAVVYDVAHNMAKVEVHQVGGGAKRLIVHRKGATRAFGPGQADLLPAYQPVGQPVLIPGTMGTASYVLAGTAEGMTTAFGSCCHGAGRTLSRHKAKQLYHGKQVRSELHDQGIVVQAGSVSGIAEEAPGAYKDVDAVVDVVQRAGLARRVARLRPLVVIKG